MARRQKLIPRVCALVTFVEIKLCTCNEYAQSTATRKRLEAVPALDNLAQSVVPLSEYSRWYNGDSLVVILPESSSGPRGFFEGAGVTSSHYVLAVSSCISGQPRFFALRVLGFGCSWCVCLALRFRLSDNASWHQRRTILVAVELQEVGLP